MKRIVLLTLALISLLPLHAQQGGAVGLISGGGIDSDQVGETTGAYLGNDQRSVTDLQLFGGVGEHHLAFTRITNSRLSDGTQLFGSSGTRHSYQWDVTTLGNNSNGMRQVDIVYPDGTENVFTETTTTVTLGDVAAPVSRLVSGPFTVLTSTAAVTDTLYENGSYFILQRQNGWRYYFTEYKTLANGSIVLDTANGTGVSYFFQFTEFTDSAQNLYTIANDAGNRVTSVTEPGGRTLNIQYGSVNLLEAGTAVSLGSITTAPTAGAWGQINLTGAAYRCVELQLPAHTLRLDEIQFLDVNGNIIPGTPYASPAYSASTGVANAFDGNTATMYRSSDTGAVIGLDQGPGTPVAVASIRFLPGSGWQSYFAGGTVQGYNIAATVGSAVVGVSASDGRSVSYAYGQVTNTLLPYSYAVVTGVTYPDGSQAQYDYVQAWPNTRPLLADASDPRYVGKFAQIHNDYQPYATYGILGKIADQKDADGNVLYSLSGSNPATVTLPTATGGNATITYTMANDLVTEKVDQLGRATSFTYSASGAGSLTSITDPLGNVTQITPSAFDNPLTITNPDGTTKTWARDDLDLPLTYTDELSRTTTYTRDASHRITQMTYADGSSESYVYNNFGQVTSHTLRNGATELASFDSTGRLISKTDALGNVTTFTYDSLDRVASTTDPLGHTTQFAYNDRGQTTQVTYADGTTSTTGYDFYGNKISSTNALGNTISVAYDQLNRLVSSTDALGHVSSLVYGPGFAGGPVVATLPSGKEAAVGYDAAWQKVSVTAGYGSSSAGTSTFGYDLDGRVAESTDPNGRTATYSYNTRGEKVLSTDALGNSTKYVYDPAGNLVTTPRPDGGAITVTYVLFSKLTS